MSAVNTSLCKETFVYAFAQRTAYMLYYIHTLRNIHTLLHTYLTKHTYFTTYVLDETHILYYMHSLRYWTTYIRHERDERVTSIRLSAKRECVAVCCSVLQCQSYAATRCNTLATRYNNQHTCRRHPCITTVMCITPASQQ